MAQCSRSQISQMHLFHELKQTFPNIPDRIVTHCIKQTRGDRAACTCILEAETGWRMAAPQPGSHSAPATPSTPRRPPAVHPTTPPHSPKPRGPPTSRSTSLPEVNRMSRATLLLIQDQLARKKKLEILVEKEREKLMEMQKREKELEEDLRARMDPNYMLSRVETLKEEIATLRSQCNLLSQQVFMKNRGVPLGETNEEYYRRHGAPFRENPPHSHNMWKCTMCTARNNPLLNLCEICGMARIAGIPQEAMMAATSAFA